MNELLVRSKRDALAREDLGITPSEVPLIPDHQHVDENVTVYAFPIFPLHGILKYNIPEHPTQSDRRSSILKRKRKTFPNSRDRPTKWGTVTTADAGPSVSIQELMASPYFGPSSLSDEMAQEWRRQVVMLMFLRLKFIRGQAKTTVKIQRENGRGKTAQECR